MGCLNLWCLVFVRLVRQEVGQINASVSTPVMEKGLLCLQHGFVCEQNLILVLWHQLSYTSQQQGKYKTEAANQKQFKFIVQPIKC